MQELKRFPSLQADIAAAANDALDRFRDESRKTVSRLVEMESSYLTVEFFRKLQTEPEKLPANQAQAKEQAKEQAASNVDRYSDNHLRRIGKYQIRLNASFNQYTFLRNEIRLMKLFLLA